MAWVIPPTGTIAMQPSSPSAAYPVSEPRVRVHPPFITTNISNWKGLKKSSHLGNQALFPREETTRARACRGPRGRGEKGWSGVAGRETMELVDFEWRFGGESNHETDSNTRGQARPGQGRQLCLNEAGRPEAGVVESGFLHGEPKHTLTSVASRLSSTNWHHYHHHPT